MGLDRGREHGRVLIAQHLRAAESGCEHGGVVVAENVDRPIDALLMDIMLPDSWGTRLAQSLQVLHPGIGIIFASGYAADDPIMMSGIEKGTRFLHKPFEIDDLLMEIAALLEERTQA